MYDFLTQRNNAGEIKDLSFINESLEHCRRVFITTDFTELYKMRGVQIDKNTKITGTNPLIQFKQREVILNGEECIAYQIIPGSDFYIKAKETDHLRTLDDNEIYALPKGVNGTPTNIYIRDYLLSRIEALKFKGSKANKFISYNTIYEKFEIDGKIEKERKRKIIHCLLNHFKTKGEITDYNIIMHGREYDKIEVIVNKKRLKG
jgi:hypothetical protein